MKTTLGLLVLALLLSACNKPSDDYLSGMIDSQIRPGDYVKLNSDMIIKHPLATNWCVRIEKVEGDLLIYSLPNNPRALQTVDAEYVTKVTNCSVDITEGN